MLLLLVNAVNSPETQKQARMEKKNEVTSFCVFTVVLYVF